MTFLTVETRRLSRHSPDRSPAVRQRQTRRSGDQRYGSGCAVRLRAHPPEQRGQDGGDVPGVVAAAMMRPFEWQADVLERGVHADLMAQGMGQGEERLDV